MTTSSIYFMCTNVDEDTVFEIFFDRTDYLYSENPVYRGVYKEIPLEYFFNEVKEFFIDLNCVGILLSEIQIAEYELDNEVESG